MTTLSEPCLGLELIQLTSDDQDDYPSDPHDSQEDYIMWLDDWECQENLPQILSLTPDETYIDENNHVQLCTKLFFQELGYLTEEPEPIDPSCDYEQEARLMLEERNRTRRKHINISRPPSLIQSRSGVSSSSSSVCHHDSDVRSPHYMGIGGGDFSQSHCAPYLQACDSHSKPIPASFNPIAAYHLNRIRHS